VSRASRLAVAALLLSFAGEVLFAQESLPPGKWWKRPEVIRQLGLSQAQQDRLDQVFLQHANVLIDLRAEIQKRSIALRSELDRPQLDRQSISTLAKQVGQARSRLFEQELLLLVDMRAVLSAEQWNRFRRALDARENAGRGQKQRRR
jgi:Spy/CpxP family protein refolding chaperone